MHDLHLYIRKMLTNREMVKFKNRTFFDFLYTFTIKFVTTGARKVRIEYMIYFICSEQSIKKSFRHAKRVARLVLYSRKLLPIKLPLLFKKCVG